MPRQPSRQSTSIVKKTRVLQFSLGSASRSQIKLPTRTPTPLSSRTEPISTSTTRAMCTSLIRGNPLIMTYISALTWVPAVKSLRPIAQSQWKHFVSLIVSTPDPKVPAKTFRFSRSSWQVASSMLFTRSPGLIFKLERLLENYSTELASVIFWCFLKIK